MAKITQVVLMKAKSYTDGRYKFKQNIPVTMRDENEAAKYASNAMFAVRTIDDGRADVGITSQKVNAGDPFAAAVSEDSVRLPKRKTSKKVTATAKKKLMPKQGE